VEKKRSELKFSERRTVLKQAAAAVVLRRNFK
jgi:hypothetical protein